MKKVLKGTLAAAAATALLAGGMGTYATWSENKDVSAGQVNSGHLTLLTSSARPWTYANNTPAPATPTIVAGDVLTASYDVTISSSGDNLQGVLTVGGFDDTRYPGITVEVVPDPTTFDGVTGSGNAIAVAGKVDDVITVNLKITAASDAAQKQALDLTQLNVKLEQTRS